MDLSVSTKARHERGHERPGREQGQKRCALVLTLGEDAPVYRNCVHLAVDYDRVYLAVDRGLRRKVHDNTVDLPCFSL